MIFLIMTIILDGIQMNAKCDKDNFQFIYANSSRLNAIVLILDKKWRDISYDIVYFYLFRNHRHIRGETVTIKVANINVFLTMFF